MPLRQGPDAAFPSGRGTKLACVELVKADKMDVVVLGGLQFAGEPCAGIAAEHRAPGAESLNGEQIPRPAQALDVAEVHDPVPFRLTQGTVVDVP